MDISNFNSLLALLLALHSPEVDITADESLLRDLGNKIYLDPDEWEEIQRRLGVILKKNPSLNVAYQSFKMQLEAANMTEALAPTLAELAQLKQLAHHEVVIGRSPRIPEDKGGGKNPEINNITIASTMILPEPEKFTNKLSWIQRVLDALKHPIEYIGKKHNK